MNTSELGKQAARLGTISWTTEQFRVIEADATERILVDAGPGTGKTAVVCARVAWLIDHAGLEPTEIWLVSFTRTAVHELRNRIGTFLSEPSKAAGIRIATIDAHSWAIQSGFNRDATLTGSYEDNIRNVIHLIQTSEGVFQYVANVRHLFVDEAQDVVGARVELVLELINSLPEESGVTVMCDEAQAIYGFSEDEVSADIKGTLPESIREFMGEKFSELELTEIHRTDDATLCEVFAKGRAILRKARTKPEKTFHGIRELISESNHGDLGGHREDLQSLPDDLADSFLLFRRRGEALEASGYLGLRPHRLRMSGLPAMIHDWIGLLLWDWPDQEMTQADFNQRWSERMKGRTDFTADTAWDRLVRLVGLTKTRVSVARLAQKLAGGSPPIDLCLPDFGYEGPIVGTIHGAKGREADQVRLYLPHVSDDQHANHEDIEEESRVLFVGASRARKALYVGRGATKAFARRLDPSGRAFTPYPFSKGKKQARSAVEIGRIGDVGPEGLVGKEFFPSVKDAKKAQARIIAASRQMVNAEAKSAGKELNWAYGVTTEKCPEEPFVYLSQRVNMDMFGIAEKVNEIVAMNRWKPPIKIPYLRSFGTRTIAVAPDDPVRETLHGPWRDSGFMLAPLLLGYGIVYFRF